MNQEQFVEAIKMSVTKSAIFSTVGNLEEPPGRQPRTLHLELSHWYNKLDEDQKQNIKNIVELAVNETVFSFLCVIDGVRTVIDNPDEDAAFKLSYKTNGIEYVLNAPDEDYLHDIYNAE